jgi:ribosomal protein S6
MVQDTKYYELAYLLSPALSAEDAGAAENEIRDILSGFSATIDTWDTPKRKNLPYPINKATDAYFGAIRFTTERENAPTLQEKLREDSKVLRFTLMQWHKPTPRKPMKPRTGPKEEQVPVDAKALDDKLEAMFGEQTPTNESQ